MIHSFLLIGQSNMAGRGYLPEAEKIDPTGILVLRNGRWQEFFRPVNPDRDFSGVNLAESFAEKYAQKYGVEVGLIPCADGGTSLEQWKPGGLLFDHAVYQARLASRTSTIAGVLWHQGEADCDVSLHATYEERFIPLMNTLREELALQDVPFLLGGLGDFLKDCPLDEKLKNYVYVNDALKKIAQKHPMTGFVSAEGLGANPDNLHFNAKALYEFGIRYFDEFEKLRDPNKVFTEKADMEDAIRTEMEKL
ncbi:MAG: sialate O-acetylesterase [Ruminococcaceae bacterium]|nr:sialate O-acetylesterase [Oscillospiraceae bacterium]